MIVLVIVILLALLDIAALRWGQDSTDGREGYAWELKHHGQDGFSAEHYAFSAL